MTNQVVEMAKTAFNALQPIFGVIDVAGRTSLTQEEVDALAYELDAAKRVKKDIAEAVDARTAEVRHVFFSMADGEVGENEPFTLYSPEHSLKMVRQISETGGGIDQSALLSALYTHFGEEPGTTDGKAWKVWTKITDPVQTRTLNTGKLEAELSKALNMSVGKKAGATTLYLPLAAVEAAKVEPRKTESFYVRAMTKDEQKDAVAGVL